MRPKGRVLVVEDDPEMLSLLRDELAFEGYETSTATNAEEALARIAEEEFDVLVTDLIMPGMGGDALLPEARALEPDMAIVVITAFGSIESAVDAIKAGASHYVTKPFHMKSLLEKLARAMQERELAREVLEADRPSTRGAPRIVAESAGMRRAVATAIRAATADTPVLLLGESGTGKELLARLIHHANAQRTGSFIAVNCSAIPESLLESQLFGHRRGSFTDAREDRPGFFLEAHRGTILLDEVGDTPASIQAKLLRVLQEGEIQPVGAPGPVKVDARVVGATNRDLEALVQSGRFRQDLFYRLNVISIRVPPLRERRRDLLPLIIHFLRKHGSRLGRPGCSLGEGVLPVLENHSWPGNIRELENVIERALVLGRSETITLADLPEQLRKPARPQAPPGEGPRSLADLEREHILKTLRSVNGNKAAAARILGLSRKTLYRKLEEFKIP